MFARRPALIRHSPVALLLALALLTRLLIPAGWMPGANASGFRLELCSGFGPPPPAMLKAAEDVAKRLNGSKHGGKDRANGDQACGFGALALGWEAISAPAIAAPGIAAAAWPFRTFSVAVGRGLAAPPPPSTGPPAIA
jgi:hypothetical protein